MRLAITLSYDSVRFKEGEDHYRNKKLKYALGVKLQLSYIVLIRQMSTFNCIDGLSQVRLSAFCPIAHQIHQNGRRGSVG